MCNNFKAASFEEIAHSAVLILGSIGFMICSVLGFVKKLWFSISAFFVVAGTLLLYSDYSLHLFEAAIEKDGSMFSALLSLSFLLGRIVLIVAFYVFGIKNSGLSYLIIPNDDDFWLESSETEQRLIELREKFKNGELAEEEYQNQVNEIINNL